MQQEEIKEKIKKAALFFRDESVPMHVRVGVATAIGLIITFPFWVNLGKHDPMSQVITSDSFPTGDSGLADSSAEKDKAQAALVEYENEANESNNQDKATEKVEEKADSIEALPEPEINRGPFKMLPLNLKVPRAIIQGPDKTIWLADKTGIFSFQAGALSKGKLIMNSETYDAEYNSDLPPLSSVYSAKDGSFWAGFSDGTLMRYNRYEWKHIRGKNRNSEDSITSFGSLEDKIFVGSKALYQWDNRFNELLADPEWRGKWITAFGSNPEIGTLMASKASLFKYDKTWLPFWEGSAQDGSIDAISFAEDGTILLGTGAGLIRLSAKGIILERSLIGEKVKSISIADEGTLWVGTRGHGLRYFDGENWYKAAAAQGLGDWTTEILLDNQKRLWVGVTGTGVVIANSSKVADWIKSFPDQDQSKIEPRIFRNPCEAADALINKVSFSNQVASRVIDGTRYVFFRGHQVCPSGVGYYRNDNSTILLKDWNLITFRDDKRSEFTIPKEFPADKVNLVFYDSKNQIWLASEEKGLSKFKDDKIEELNVINNNPISTILESADGVLWLGTTPPFDKEKNTYNQKNLHLFTESSWASYDSRDGLLQNSTLALSQFNDGTFAVATRLGISVIKDKQVVNYGKDQGLNFEHCADVTFDKKGRIWITHQYFGNGINWIDGKTLYSLTKEQGLFSDKISKVAIDRSSNIWLLASNGEVGVYPRSYLEQKASKKVIPERTIRSIPLGKNES